MAASRFSSEVEADEAIQASYAKNRSQKAKGLIYVVCAGLGLALGFLVPLLAGGSLDPLLYPIWPVLLFPMLFAIIALALGLVFNFKKVGQAWDELDRKSLIKRYTHRSIAVTAPALVFMILFLTMVPSPSWLEVYVDENHGTYDQTVSGWSAGDFRFVPNDEFYITEAILEIEVVGNNSVDIFIGELKVFEAIEDIENVSEVEGKSLSGAFRYNTTSFTYDGGSFEPGVEYVIRVYNYENEDDTTLKIYVKRDISELLVNMVIGCTLGFVVIGAVGLGLMQGRKKMKVRPAAERPTRAGRARDAKDMFKGMEDEVEGMFGPAERGYRGGRVPAPAAGAGAAGRGRPRPPIGEPMGGRARPRRPPEARPRPGREPGRERRPAPVVGPATDVDLVVAPKGVKKTIACPRCKKRFGYTKIEGKVIEIKCPNCGKKGRVGAKKKAPPGPPAAAARPPRPAERKRPAPTPTPSPLDEITGAPATPAAPRKKKTIACPRCKKRFTVEEKPRPFQIECPHCGKTGMLK